MIRRPLLRLLLAIAQRRPLVRIAAGIGASIGTLWMSLQWLFFFALLYGLITLAVMVCLSIVLYREGYDVGAIGALVLGKSFGWPLIVAEALIAIAVELLSRD